MDTKNSGAKETETEELSDYPPFWNYKGFCFCKQRVQDCSYLTWLWSPYPFSFQGELAALAPGKETTQTT